MEQSHSKWSWCTIGQLVYELPSEKTWHGLWTSLQATSLQVLWLHDSGVFRILWGGAEYWRSKVWGTGGTVGSLKGVPLPPGGVCAGGLPLPEFFFNFWFKMGHFLFKKCLCLGRGGGVRRPVPPPNMPMLTSSMESSWVSSKSSRQGQWRKPDPQFGWTKKNFAIPQIQKFGGTSPKFKKCSMQQYLMSKTD